MSHSVKKYFICPVKLFHQIIFSLLIGFSIGITQINGQSNRAPTIQINSTATEIGWGLNDEGQITPPDGINSFVAIAAGGKHSLALKDNGTVVGWGENSFGKTTPTYGLSDVIAIAAGDKHSLALRSGGTVVAWGGNSFGQTNIPKGLRFVTAIAAGIDHCLALKSNGTVVGWGANSQGQATPPEGLNNIVAIAAGGFSSSAIKSDGTVVTWGRNLSPPQVITNAVATAVGEGHILVLKSNGSVVCWGRNDVGQATLPEGLSDVVAIAAGYYHSLALKSDGTVVGWGWNDDGQSNPLDLDNVTAISAGREHSLAIRKRSERRTTVVGKEDMPITITYEDIISSLEIVDPDGDTITLNIEEIYLGTLTKDSDSIIPGETKIEPGESVVWTPELNQNGVFQLFRIRASDGDLFSINTANIFIELEKVNDASVFVSDPDTELLESIEYLYEIEIDDLNEAGDIEIIGEIVPSWLTFDKTAQTLSGTPGFEHVGDHDVKLIIIDGEFEIEQSFVLTVNNWKVLPVPKTPPVSKVPATLPNLKLSKEGYVRVMLYQDDGKLIVGGEFSSVNGVPRNNLARINSNGSVDLTWDPNIESDFVFIPPDYFIILNDLDYKMTELYGTINALAISGTDLYVGGNFNRAGGHSISKLAKISLVGNGEPDKDFIFAENENFAEIRVLAVDDANLFVGGVRVDSLDEEIPGIVKADRTSGSKDTEWSLTLLPGEDGGSVNALVIDGNDLFVGGNFGHDSGRIHILKVTANGSGVIDSNWRIDEKILVGDGIFETYFNLSEIRGIAIYEDYIFIGGSRFFIKVSTTGTGIIDQSFYIYEFDDFFNDEYRLISLSIDNGRLYYITESAVLDIYDIIYDFRLTISSELYVYDLEARHYNFLPRKKLEGLRTVVAKNNNVVMGGSFNFVDNNIALAVAKLDPVTLIHDLSWPAHVEVSGKIKSLRHQTDGKLIVGGDFWFVDGVERSNILRLNTDNTLDQNWNPDVRGIVNALHVDETEEFVYVGGEFEFIGDQKYIGIAKIHLSDSGIVVEDWKPLSRELFEVGITSIAQDKDDLYITGSFQLAQPCDYNNECKGKILRVNASSGEIDYSWGSNAFLNIVRKIALDENYVYFHETDSEAGALSKISIYDIDIFGGMQGNVNALLVHDGYLYFGGRILDNVGRHGLFRYSIKNEKIDFGWNPLFKTDDTDEIEIFDLQISNNDLYIAGNFTQFGQYNISNIVKIDIETTEVDPNFNYTVNGKINTLLVDEDDVYIGGEFTEVGNRRRVALAFLPTIASPVLFQDSTDGFIVKRNVADGEEVTHFRITDIQNGNLFLADGVSPIDIGDFITVGEGAVGLQFSEGGTVSIVSSLDNTVEGTGLVISTGTGSAGELFPSEGLTLAPGNIMADTENLVSTLTLGIREFERLYSFNQPVYEITETEAGFTSFVAVISKVGSDQGNVDYRTVDGSAISGTNYLSQSATANFAVDEDQFAVPVVIKYDNRNNGNLIFTIELQKPDEKSALAYPSTALIKIIDYDITGLADSQLQRTLPSTTIESDGEIEVNIDQPNNVNGQWRLLGDINWLDSSGVKMGLTTGNHLVEFKPVSGYVHPTVSTLPVNAGKTTVFPSGSAQYVPIISAKFGSLNVAIFPENIGGQWRLEGSTEWRNREEKIENLPIGNHTVEFKPVTGFSTPPNRIARVVPELESKIKENYLLAEESNGVVPEKLSLAEATTISPYFYNGLIYSKIGIGSGVLVKERVVLTAAHVLFDDLSLSYVIFPRWFYRKHSDEYEPPPKRPRGWVVLSGYQKQRAIDNTPGFSTPESQNLDAAALYFFEDAGEGAFGGYLVTTPEDDWLSSNEDKILAGYPIDNIPATDRGKMHATPAGNYSFTKTTGNVYTTTEIKSYAGNSGGPIFVKNNGNFYPAGIYLGGEKEAIVRAIDRKVVDLINKAEIAGTGGGNNLSGGAIFVEPGITDDLFQIGTLTVEIAPGTAAKSAKWKIIDFSNDLFESEKQIALIPGEFIIEFIPVSGFLTPSTRIVEVVADQSSLLQANYIADNDYSKWRMNHFGTDNITNNSLRSELWGDTANPDYDQLDNILEYFMGLDPNSNDFYGTNKQLFKVIANGIQYRRYKNTQGINARVEWSTDLKNWNTDSLNEKMMKDLGDVELIQTTLPELNGEKVVFFRIVVDAL